MLLLGVATFLLLWAALAAFARADIASVKALLRWALAIGAVLLAALLVLTGRGGLAVFALSLLGPSLWSWWRGAPASIAQPRAQGPMTRAEAWEVLGLRPGASAPEIRAAHLRLMRAAHPDSGGSDWLAARINQARDILLG